MPLHMGDLIFSLGYHLYCLGKSNLAAECCSPLRRVLPEIWLAIASMEGETAELPAGELSVADLLDLRSDFEVSLLVGKISMRCFSKSVFYCSEFCDSFDPGDCPEDGSRYSKAWKLNGMLNGLSV